MRADAAQLRANKLTVLTILSTCADPLASGRSATRPRISGRIESDEAEREIEKIDLKLQGINQMRSLTPQSVEGQVQCLINDATDMQNLSLMYIWWMPWC